MKKRRKSTLKSSAEPIFLRYAAGALFLILFASGATGLADELATSGGKQYEGIIVDQSPSQVTVKLKDKTVKFDRDDLKYIKRWDKKENDALAERWKRCTDASAASDARQAEIDFAESVRYSDRPWEIYEEDAFIAFHHEEGIIKSRLKGKVGDYCKKVADKLGYDEFKVYDKSGSADWSLKFKFYSYRDFKAWKKAVEAVGYTPDMAVAFASGNRRVSFSESYMKMDTIYHEIVHSIYNEMIRNANIPQWWSEGVAQYAFLTTTEARDDISNSRFRALNNQYIPLSKVCLYTDEDSRSHNYEDGLSAVYFLVRERGKDKFKELNYSLRAGKKFENVLSQVYGFKDINELEKALIEYLKKTDVADIVGEI